MDWDTFKQGLRYPFWAPGLTGWSWLRSDGVRQGLHLFGEEPGLANLVWLALDTDTPPPNGTDMRTFPQVMWVFASAHRPFEGTTLEQWCATHTLRQFSELPMAFGHLGNLIRIARKKVQHAHP